MKPLILLGAVALTLAACAPNPPASRAPVTAVPQVRGVQFNGGGLPRGVTRSNASLAQDFVDLTFALESGQKLRGLLRYEGPVRVVLRSPSLAPYSRDLERLLARLRNEAGVPIQSTRDPALAQIHIEAVPTREIQRAYPGAACFIVPGETNWAEFRRRSSRARVRWSDQTTLGTTGIFLPSDSTPQDVRDCLHEEIGQALGPANDIYRLSDSVFNDDNFHSILTSFDMLMLRVLYSPQMRSGLPPAAAKRRALEVLNSINPQGRGAGQPPRAPESASWKKQIETAMTRGNARNRRLKAADTAVRIAQAMQPTDHRLAVALMTRGRLTMRSNSNAAAADFAAAYRQLRQQLGDNNVRTTQAVLHLAIIALESARYDRTLELVAQAIPVAERGENAVLLSGLYAIRAEALLKSGDATRAQNARLNSMRWARYAFGDLNGAIARAQAALEEMGGSPSRNATPW
ncbi:DUF2927 domain-containing protein [Halovulum sp. GXIMD14793]